jgi:hypothetical protein
MSNCTRRAPLLRRPAHAADPGVMVNLRVEDDGSWRRGFRALVCAPSTAETGEVPISGSARSTSTGRLVGRSGVWLA